MSRRAAPVRALGNNISAVGTKGESDTGNEIGGYREVRRLPNNLSNGTSDIRRTLFAGVSARAFAPVLLTGRRES